VVDKIAAIKLLIEKECRTEGREIDLEADGGINLNTAPMVVKAGAKALVCGAAIFKAVDIQKAVEELRKVAGKAGKKE